MAVVGTDIFARRRASILAGETVTTEVVPAPAVQHDFFISHASEDKESFVRALAAELTSRSAMTRRR